MCLVVRGPLRLMWLLGVALVKGPRLLESVGECINVGAACVAPGYYTWRAARAAPALGVPWPEALLAFPEQAQRAQCPMVW